MIITDKFVFVHLPKTGGTFTQKIVMDVYQSRKKTSLGLIKQAFGIEYCKKLYVEERLVHLDELWGQHGGVNQIPKEYVGRSIVSIIRNPYDWYASVFAFGWWKKRPYIHKNLSFKSFSSYPDISMSDLLDIQNRLVVLHGESLGADFSNIGFYTWRFVNTYFKAPDTFLRLLSQNKVKLGENALQEFMHPVHFLFQESLNKGLERFLGRLGFKNLQFILDHKVVLPKNVGRNQGSDAWKNVISSEHFQQISRQDRLIFELFPTYKLTSYT